MSEMAWIVFCCTTALAAAFFLFKKRQFDLLDIALVGALFYFSPLFWGLVLQSSPEFDSTIPQEVYLIATAYVVALVVAGLIPAAPFEPPRSARDLSGWYLALAVAGLAGSLISSKGAIINADKVQAMAHVGYFYTTFEIAASLACISAVIERRWLIVVASVFLLAADLLVGFRVFSVLAALGVALVLLRQYGDIRSFTKIPTYGPAAVLVVVAMLLVHTARFAIFDQIAAMENAPRVVSTSEMRSDTLQYQRLLTPTNQAAPGWLESPFRWLEGPLRLLQMSEPVVIQATLAATVKRDLSCRSSNIFKSIYLLVPPGLGWLVPNPYPPTFYDEYQPILYPGITYGTGGNIWAEMLCRFGYAGVLIFGVILIASLIFLRRLLSRVASSAIPPIAFGGVIVAFYINRNDLNYTLVMLRQVLIVFVLAYGLSIIAAKLQQSGKTPAVIPSGS